jgi:tRNA modification GTPase
VVAIDEADDAMAALARAPSLRVADILLDQAGGAWDREMQGLRGDLATDPGRAKSRVEALMGRSVVGLRMLEGWRVVLTGRPNVGKSRLLNALAGYRRAVVSETPGTTRDVVTVRTALDGWPVDLLDTAGLRASSEAIEAEGIARARASLAGADLILAVFDRSGPLSAEDRAVLDAYPQALKVANKADLPGWEAGSIGALAVSAANGAGLPELTAEIARRLVPDPPPPGSAVPFTEAMVRGLEAIRAGLRE